MLDFNAGGSSQTSTEIFSHPRGIIVIAGTELWERVSFHGMQALLVIYMADLLALLLVAGLAASMRQSVRQLFGCSIAGSYLRLHWSYC